MNGNSKKLQSVILAMFIAMSACLEHDKSEPPPEKQNIFDIEKAVCHSIDILLLYISSENFRVIRICLPLQLPQRLLQQQP